MFWSRRKGEQLHICPKPDCPKQQFPVKDLLFLCPNLKCPRRDSDGIPDKPAQWAGRTLFRPERFSHAVPCPYSPDPEVFVKVCPYCWNEQPFTDNRAETIAVLGSSISGKTCFVTGLIHQIDKHMTGPLSRSMSLGWRDEKGRKYFLALEREIYRHGRLPRGTLKKAEIETMHITLRFPIQGWHRLLRGPRGVVSLIFPDPAGELIENLKNAYTLRYLSRARAIIFMVDPWMSDRYREQRQAMQDPLDPSFEAQDAATTLNAVVLALNRGLATGPALLNKQLAIVLTKCDEKGLFDPDDPTYGIPRQGRTYSPEIAREISRRVERHLLDLGMNNVVTTARLSFRRVCFFAASPLGSTPIRTATEDGTVDIKVVDPRPRHVEDPLLWIFHEWGYW